ncbi:ABC transporter ATP-binding protein [Bacteriovorax sp. DB6_IX]|uniref:ABC transporter ATP-binding protein n=1 Tax=Bacteriovorax sp. DB6_IX TaxID=1353530 RepID=UPI00038A0D44|nr:ATP-binding cassette domain-containing protein [Bacteriovorax sp. DB6_IX]EQC50488.1 ABC transporter, ATP-binding protein [Bacteriovorax sp. DB6_IX]
MLSFENPAVGINDLTKTFGNHTVLNKLNFDIPRGKITTILGFSGAGKSTLLKHILGLHKPTSGQISVLGRDLSELEEVDMREFRQNFGMLFQYAALFDSMTTFGNVAFPLREFTDLNEDQIKEKCFHLLKSVGLEEVSYNKLPSELSGGMRKRVGLARALALSPKIMLYDEPTTGLDPITTKMVNDLIVETGQIHKENELTSIIISHDVKATLEISDYVAFLNRGNIVEYLPAKDFANSDHPLVKEFINL